MDKLKDSSPIAPAGTLLRKMQDTEPGRAFWLVLAAFALVYLLAAFAPPLLDDADASHAVVAREMVRSGDWTVLRMNGVVWPVKAPLHYWLVAGSLAVFGDNSFAVRLPVTLSVLFLVWLVYRFGCEFHGNIAALVAACSIGGSFGVFLFTRIMIPEAIYALQFTLAFLCFLRGWTKKWSMTYAWIGFFLFVALAVLTRGLIGIVLPLCIAGAFLLITGTWKRCIGMMMVPGLILFFLVGAPWHILNTVKVPAFLWTYFINEHFLRAVGTRYPIDYAATPLWLWWSEHILWLFPWIIFLPAAFRSIRSSLVSRLEQESGPTVLCLVWAAVPFIFFSFTSGSRMEYYAFSAWPAIALLLGLGVQNAITSESIRSPLLNEFRALGLAGIFTGLLLIGAVLFSLSVDSPNLGTTLQQQTPESYRLSMAHALEITSATFAFLRAPALLSGVALLAGFPLAYWFVAKRQYVRSMLSIALSMSIFFGAANLAYSRFNSELSSSSVAQVINQRIKPEEILIIYGEFDASSSIAFYTGRQVYIYNGRYNNLERGSKLPGAPKIFLEDAQFAELWQGEQQIYLFVPQQFSTVAQEKLVGLQWCLISESSGKLLITNCPSSAD